MSNLKKIIFASVMLACTIVFSRFLSFKTSIITISFAFLPIMISAILLGPWWTMLISGLADLIGALLFPFGAYFVGYTFSALLNGLIYGLFLYKSNNLSNKKFLIKLIISTFLVILICNTCLNTLWIYITTKKALFAILPIRLLKQLVMFPIQIIIIYFLNLSFKKFKLYDSLQSKNQIADEEDDENEEPVQTTKTTTSSSKAKKDEA